jgi:L-arabinose isomerase
MLEKIAAAGSEEKEKKLTFGESVKLFGKAMKISVKARGAVSVVVSLADMRDRFRLTANVVDVVTPPAELPHLPVARAVWQPRPSFPVAAEAWLTAGGAHHTVMSTGARIAEFEAFAQIAGVELLVIDEDTTRRGFADQVKWNAAYYRLAGKL